MHRCISIALLAAAMFLPATPAGAARKLVSHQGLTAYMADDFSCADKVAIFVTGKRSDFEGEKVSLQRLTGGVRATLGFECSTPIEAIVFVGLAGKQEVWRGLAAKSNGWVLVDLAARGPAADSESGNAGRVAAAPASAAPAPAATPVGNPLESLDAGPIRALRARTRTSPLGILP